jgi:LPPG:FO 2-phospho-L-lactate transferase
MSDSPTPKSTPKPTPMPTAPDASAQRPVVALCGGVGAARFLSGLMQVVAPERITAVVNTGDDHEFYGVHVSPDLDIVTYTLAGVIDRENGYGLAGDTFDLVDRLAELGHETWFRLGDRDFAHCLHRTLRLRAGDGLAAVTESLCRAHSLAIRLVPMSEEPCPTNIALRDGGTMHFEHYLIRERAPDTVERVDLSAAERAAPTPGLLGAISNAAVILVCPSNPVVSVGPILAVSGVRDAIEQCSAPVVAVSPIVGDAPIKGPASQLLRGVGADVSALGVARYYGSLIDGYVFDERDADQEKAIAELGLGTRVTDTIMREPEVAARLARTTLELAAERTPAITELLK